MDSGDFVIKIPEDHFSTFAPHAGKDIIFELRPEDIHNAAFVPSGIHVGLVEAKVDVIELMGYEIMLYLISGKQSFVARVDPRTSFSTGEKVQLAFNMDNFHIFDPNMDRENPVAIH